MSLKRVFVIKEGVDMWTYVYGGSNAIITKPAGKMVYNASRKALGMPPEDGREIHNQVDDAAVQQLHDIGFDPNNMSSGYPMQHNEGANSRIREMNGDGYEGGDDQFDDGDDGLGEDDIFAGKRLPPANEAHLRGVHPADAIRDFIDNFEDNQFGDSIWRANMRTLREQVIAVAVACNDIMNG